MVVYSVLSPMMTTQKKILPAGGAFNPSSFLSQSPDFLKPGLCYFDQGDGSIDHGLDRISTLSAIYITFFSYRFTLFWTNYRCKVTLFWTNFQMFCQFSWGTLVYFCQFSWGTLTCLCQFSWGTSLIRGTVPLIIFILHNFCITPNDTPVSLES